MTATATKTFEILGHEFDLDQLADITNHGMSGGVSGFIYSSELAHIFDNHEDDIFDLLDTYADDLGFKSGMNMIINSLTEDDEFYTMQDIKEAAVWMYVELTAYDLLCSNPDFVRSPFKFLS